MEFKKTSTHTARHKPAGTPADTPSELPSAVSRSPLSQRARLFVSSNHKPIIIALTVAAMLGAAFATGNVLYRASLPNSVTDSSDSNSSAPADLPVLLPQQKSSQQINWNRVSPPDSDPVFAYTDTINSVAISVSQQQVPSSFATDTSQHIADLAKSYNATTKLTAGDTTFYIGTSAKGPQSVIFSKNNLLIMIKSQHTISDDAWRQYVASLK